MSANRLWDLVTKRERVEEKIGEAVTGEARFFREWSNAPYHGTFVAWMREQADKPIRTDQNMGVDVMRSNTFKEILAHLDSRKRWSDGVLGA